MIKNCDMKPNRFARWALARRKVAFVRNALAAGRVVYFSTSLRRVKISKPAHADLLQATKNGLYIPRGKSWDCLDGCQLEAI